MCLSPVSKAAGAAISRSADADKDVNAQVRDVNEEVDDGEERVLSAGLFPPEDGDEEQRQDAGCEAENQTSHASAAPEPAKTQSDSMHTEQEQQTDVFTRDETLFVFDYDDTLLPSTWLQRNKLRLDSGSVVSPWHREQLQTVENTAIELIRNAKQCGNVVLVTNAERGWIELSCQKFLPGLLPLLENVKCVSARTTFESRDVTSPLDWKLGAFEQEIEKFYGNMTLQCPHSRKNVLSLGDSVHEREALLRATRELPNCCPKSLKFVERPDLSQIIKQHSLVNSCFHRIVHQEGFLDLCIKCT